MNNDIMYPHLEQVLIRGIVQNVRPANYEKCLEVEARALKASMFSINP